MTRKQFVGAVAGLAIAAILGGAVQAQVGKGIADLNSMAEKDLLALPNMTPAIAKGIMDKRPFASIVDVQTYLLSQNLTPAQTTAIYEKAFVHLNLNTTTAAEVMLVPRIGRNMPREFEEYRPWKNWAQFDRDIGKYVRQNPGELERMKQYVFIPINLNTATDEEILTIPNLGANMLKEFKEYRPWKTKEQFEKEISKYVGPKETARLWRYVVIVP